MKRLCLVATILLAGCSINNSEQDVQLENLLSQIELLQEGKPAIINFWASWCSFCKEELPLFESIYQQGQIQVIAINLQEKNEVATSYWTDGGYTFSSIQDPDSLLRRHFEVFTQPTTFFVNSNGEVSSRKDGPLSEAQLDIKVQDLLDQKSIEAPIGIQISSASVSIQHSPVTPLLRSWYGKDVDHLIPLEEILSGGPRKDGIPSIDTPQFLSIDAVDFLEESDIGLLVDIENDVRFYPYRILNWHEIVNDTIGHTPVVITYCPLCATGVVYDRTTSKGVTEFGVSGFLYQSNLLMYDRETDSLWNQVTAEAVVGPLTGDKIKLLSSDVVTFKTLKAEYSHAKVLSTETGHNRGYDRAPYSGYAEDPTVMFPVRKRDDRLFSKELVYGVVVNDIPKAYSLSTVVEKGTINDAIDGIPITLSWNSEKESISATAGDAQIIPIPIFWFSWVAQYPETELYE